MAAAVLLASPSSGIPRQYAETSHVTHRRPSAVGPGLPYMNRSLRLLNALSSLQLVVPPSCQPVHRLASPFIVSAQRKAFIVYSTPRRLFSSSAIKLGSSFMGYIGISSTVAAAVLLASPSLGIPSQAVRGNVARDASSAVGRRASLAVVVVGCFKLSVPILRRRTKSKRERLQTQ